MSQFRQGDIFFEAIGDSFPETLKKKTDGIIAYGEVTGHKHEVTSDLADATMFVDERGDILVQSKKDITIAHDEHGSVTLPAGPVYNISRQREYDPLSAERERQVAD
jgi:hypothetical protein